MQSLFSSQKKKRNLQHIEGKNGKLENIRVQTCCALLDPPRRESVVNLKKVSPETEKSRTRMANSPVIQTGLEWLICLISEQCLLNGLRERIAVDVKEQQRKYEKDRLEQKKRVEEYRQSRKDLTAAEQHEGDWKMNADAWGGLAADEKSAKRHSDGNTHLENLLEIYEVNRESTLLSVERESNVRTQSQAQIFNIFGTAGEPDIVHRKHISVPKKTSVEMKEVLSVPLKPLLAPLDSATAPRKQLAPLKVPSIRL